MRNNDENIEHNLEMVTPNEVTASGKSYFVSEQDTIGLFLFITNEAVNSDAKAYVAQTVLDGGELPKHSDALEHLTKIPGPRIIYLRKKRQLLLELFITRLMDNFSTYLSDIVREAFKAKPEILKYKETVRLDQLMRFDSIDSFLHDLIDQEVLNLSYFGFSALEDWLQKKLGLGLSPTPQDRNAIIEFIETRNAIVHNHGLIDHKYLSSVQNTKFELGEYRKVDIDYLYQAHSLLNNVVSRIDELFSSKFNLPRISIDTTKNESQTEITP
jgi:hypothetical protein